MSDKSNKITVFTTAFRPLIGGSEIALEEIVKRLPEFFFNIITPRFDSSLAREEAGGNFRIHRVGFGSKLDKFLFPVLGFLRAKEMVNSDIVHAYQASYGAGAAWLFKIFKPKTVFILTLQEGKDLKRQGFFIKFFRKLIINKANMATAISRYLEDYLRGVRNDLPVLVIPNGVDIDHFAQEFSYGETAGLEEKLGIMPDDKVIISISRLVHKNGVDLLIEALSELNKNGNNYKLLLIGDGPLEQSLKSKVKSLELEKSVIFAGSVNNRDLPIYLKISDVFVRPSRSEGLGISFLEAMAAGIPIIGPRVGGIPDFLEDRKTGLFCSLVPEDIAFKIRIILENDKLNQEIISNARALVKERYNWNIIALEFDKLYKSLK